MKGPKRLGISSYLRIDIRNVTELATEESNHNNVLRRFMKCTYMVIWIQNDKIQRTHVETVSTQAWIASFHSSYISFPSSHCVLNILYIYFFFFFFFFFWLRVSASRPYFMLSCLPYLLTLSFSMFSPVYILNIKAAKFELLLHHEMCAIFCQFRFCTLLAHRMLFPLVQIFFLLVRIFHQISFKK
jgi:hypothetical protein